MWNDTDIPLAYLISFRTYGTWLHGDERGSTDRFHNVYKAPHIDANQRWHRYNEQHLKSAAVTLSHRQRILVEQAIREVCDNRNWRLHAINIRTNHVHAVVSIGLLKPDRALNAFKAYCTRTMRREGFWNEKYSPWADKGSCRYLWNDQSVSLASYYVESCQGANLRDFDRLTENIDDPPANAGGTDKRASITPTR